MYGNDGQREAPTQMIKISKFSHGRRVTIFRHPYP